MQAYSIHTPAFPRAIRLSRVDSWPSTETLRAQFAWSCRPARPFPAAPFRYAVPGLYCRLRDHAMLVKRQQVQWAPLPEPEPQTWKQRLSTWLDNHRGALKFWHRDKLEPEASFVRSTGKSRPLFEVKP